jgi:hypothetical protein
VRSYSINLCADAHSQGAKNEKNEFTRIRAGFAGPGALRLPHWHGGGSGDPGGPGGPGNPVDTLQGIAVSGPDKTVYDIGEALDLTGLVVQGVYSVSGAAPAPGYTLSWNGGPIVDGDTAITAAMGIKTITVAWEGKTASFDIRVRGVGTVYDQDTWTAKLQTIKDGGNGIPGTPKPYTIEIDGNFYVDGASSASFGSVQYVEVTLAGTGTAEIDQNGALFYLDQPGQTLIIDSEDLTLWGSTSNNQALIYLDNATAGLVLKNGVIRENTGGGAGVYLTGSSASFHKIQGAGIIYGYDSSDSANPLWNKAHNGDPAYGHAVYFNKDNGYYRDSTLTDDVAGNITTGTVPTSTGPGNAVGNWIKK